MWARICSAPPTAPSPTVASANAMLKILIQIGLRNWMMHTHRTFARKSVGLERIPTSSGAESGVTSEVPMTFAGLILDPAELGVCELRQECLQLWFPQSQE